MKDNPWEMLTNYPKPLVLALADQKRAKAAPCYISGGTLRDWLLGINSRDLDITVASNSFDWARSVAGELGGTFIPLDEEEDVARVVWRETCLDISSFREGAATIEEDLKKRDFTVNSLAVEFPSEIPDSWIQAVPPEIIDPLEGRNDIKSKILRISSPAAFISDPLRLLRAFRFMATLQFKIESETERQIQSHVHLLFLVAAERIFSELDAIMATPLAAKTIVAMHASSILEELMPEICLGIGVQQPASHHLDVFDHGIETLKYMEKLQKEPADFFPGHGEMLKKYLKEGRRRILLKWAALFHDLGKPETFAVREDRGGRIIFYNHEKEGVRLFEIIAERFKWSRNDREFVSRLIGVHMWPFHLNNARKKTGITPKAYLRLIKSVGEEFPGIFLLSMADSLAGRGEGKPVNIEKEIADLFDETESVYRRNIKQVLAKPLLSGHDLIADFKLEPGPLFKEILEGLENARVEKEIENREQALEWVRNYLKSYK